MAEQLILGGTATTTLVGAWELRAGSHDTTDYLARGSTYPGNLDAFKPLNGDDTTSGDATNGYQPAPKMALINCVGGSSNCQFTLGGGISSILSIFVTSGEASPGTAVLGTTESGLQITVTGLANTKVADLMVLYN